MVMRNMHMWMMVVMVVVMWNCCRGVRIREAEVIRTC